MTFEEHMTYELSKRNTDYSSIQQLINSQDLIDYLSEKVQKYDGGLKSMGYDMNCTQRWHALGRRTEAFEILCDLEQFFRLNRVKNDN